MSQEMIVTLIVTGIAIAAGLITVIVAIARGDMKKFIIEKMEEAEEKYKDYQKPEKSKLKLQYVLDAVKEKYKLGSLFLNIKKFIEYIVQINNKDM